MLRRIWRGEISLGWAFWGIGLGGLFPLFAVLFGIVGALAIGGMVGSIKAIPLPIRFFGFMFFRDLAFMLKLAATGLILICAFTVPATVIWRSASKSSSKLWRRIAKSFVVLGALSFPLLPPAAFLTAFFLYFNERMTPEFYENTPQLQSEAAEFFKGHTGLDIPEGSQLAHVVYHRLPVMDLEDFHHVILDAGDMDLQKWIASARPFGSSLAQITPERDLDWNDGGLECNAIDRPEGKFTKPICDLVSAPRKIWQIEKQLNLDNMVTLTVLEDHKLIWLLETNW
jgi:hypothetical protein